MVQLTDEKRLRLFHSIHNALHPIYAEDRNPQEIINRLAYTITYLLGMPDPTKNLYGNELFMDENMRLFGLVEPDRLSYKKFLESLNNETTE
jgi:hypothetical protein